MNRANRRYAKKPVMLFLVGALVLGAYAAEVRTWTDATGNHLWTDKKNWEPQITGNHYNIFPEGDWEVVVDGIGQDNYFWSLELAGNSGKVTIKAASDSVLLRSAASAYIKIPAGRELNIDGPEVLIGQTDINESGFINGTIRLTSGYLNTGGQAAKTFGGDAKIVVEGGVFGNKETSGTLVFTNNATLTVNGGLAKIWRCLFRSPDPPRESIVRVRMTGGTYWNSEPQYASYTTSFGPGAHFANHGGTLLWSQDKNHIRTYLSSDPYSDGKFGQGAAFAELLPGLGSTLILPTATTSSFGALHFAVDGDYDVAGTIFATNNSSVAAGNVYFANKNISLHGGATIYANGYKVSSYCVSNNDLDLTRLNLGIGGFRREAGTSQGNWQTVNFLDGIEFGAWGGDVPCAEASTYNNAVRLKIFMEGPVVYDTQDCFDPATSRTINMDCIRLDGVTELKATGGGTAALYPAAKWGEGFRTLEVAENTTLAFCTNTMAGLKTMNLKLGANARLKINMKNGDYVDASSFAEFGDGAKIVVLDIPEPLAEGTFYPVYFAPTGTDPDLSAIEYAGGDWPSGWNLAKRGNAVYLTDGKEAAYSEAREGSNKVWSGAGSDNVYSNQENWVDGELPSEWTQAFFKGCSNTVVSVDEAMVVRYLQFFQNCGPFMFDGADMTVTYPYEKDSLADSVISQTILNEGKFPVVIANTINRKVIDGKDPTMVLKSTREGSLSLTGGLAEKRPIAFAGDIRLGGVWESDFLLSLSRSTVRASRLTVLPGSTLAVTGQTGDFNEYGKGALAIAKNAVATIDGADLTFTSNNTHYVDGSLTVNCPLVPLERQTFRGDGTLTLAGGVEDAPNGVRVEGNLTLVPSDWLNDAVLSVKDNVTIAPAEDWSFGGNASLEIKNHSVLTLATGGRNVKLGGVRNTEGTLAVTGGGVVTLTSAASLGKVTLADGSKLNVANNLGGTALWIEALTVREDDGSIVFDVKDQSRVRKSVGEDGRTTYFILRDRGTVLILR